MKYLNELTRMGSMSKILAEIRYINFNKYIFLTGKLIGTEEKIDRHIHSTVISQESPNSLFSMTKRKLSHSMLL